MLLFEVILCVHNLQISQLSTSRQLTNLKVALISNISYRLLANEKTEVSTMYNNINNIIYTSFFNPQIPNKPV